MDATHRGHERRKDKRSEHTKITQTVEKHLASATSIEAKEFACTSMGIECDHWLELAGDDPHKVRDILEHSCQWENVDDCQRLVVGYRAHTYDEPVPGLAAALQSYVCKQDAQRCALSTPSP